MITQKIDGESLFEWKLRLCKAKLERELDLDWQEIVDLLGLDVSADHLRKTAYGIVEYDNYINGFDGVATTILSISDLHYPYAKPLNTYEDYIGKVDILQMNGDILDCTQLSKFPKLYRTSVMEEVIGARQYIIDLIEMIKPKKVIVNNGNHDIRLGAYLAKNIDCDVQEMMPETALDYIFDDGFTYYNRKTKAKTKYDPLINVFPDIDIEYTGTWFSVIGDSIFCHPKTFSSAPLKTAEKALYWFRNEGYQFKKLVMAHTHRVGQYKIGNSTIFEQGACCETSQMDYNGGLLINSQKEGFIVICQDKDGNTIDSKTKLIALN